MPLVKSKLKQSILDAFKASVDGSMSFSNPPSPAPPGLPKEMADKLADAYDGYAQSALAGALSVSVPGMKTGLASALVAPNFGGWSLGFSAYWAAAMFAGSGFIPVNPVFPVSLISAAASLASDIQSYLNTERNSAEAAADALASALDTATTSLMVLATTTTTPPVISNIPVA